MKIGIVNDLALATEALRRVVAMAPEHEVVWVARNGEEAVSHCASNRPDLVLMDLIMPGIDGVEATRRIMAESPCGILIVTASVDENSAKTFAAMGHGAMDAVDLPQLGRGDAAASARPLLDKLTSLARLLGADRAPKSRPQTSAHPLVAIGASAGGPSALAAVLAALPRNFKAGVIIVQHVDERFAAGMADWLNMHSALPVRIAKEGDELLPGKVLLAGGGSHLVVRNGGRIGYSAAPADEIYHPSINVFFQSVCDFWHGQAIGVLLTGMGADGAAGLKTMRAKGHHTITQDRATSAVFGMPKAAAALSAAVEILPLDAIPTRVANLIGPSSRIGLRT